VNMPAYVRHLTEDVLQNRARIEHGLPPQNIDIGRTIADSISYAFGPQRIIEDPFAVYTDLHHWASGEPDKDDPDPRMSRANLEIAGIPTAEEFAANWSARQALARPPRS
jgi:hypothetical protein